MTGAASIRVLVVDDSPTMRAVLSTRLGAEPDIEVVGTAANAAEARALIKSTDPDVVTLDIEMPGMNGLDFLEKIMTLRPTPVIVVSGSTQSGAAATARALALGAVDCYAKTEGSGILRGEDKGRLAAMVRQAASVRFAGPRPPGTGRIETGHAARPHAAPRLIAIGSSTGGVEALQTVLAGWSADCPPTLIVQHVNPRFAGAIAHTLDHVCPARVQLAEPDLPLHPGNVYLAPGERHLTVGGSGPYFARLRPGAPISGHRPSVDALFLSVAEKLGAQALGIILTGMGQDGARGLKAMADAGAYTIAQDEATCTVFGMPRAAISLGAAASVAPLGRIAPLALRKAA